MSVSNLSRRRFLTDVGTGMAVIGSQVPLWETHQADHPPYPEIPEPVLEEQGWEQQESYQEEKEDALWSIRTFEWTELRNRVREGTGGLVDIPLGGLIAMRIGNSGETRRLRGETITDGSSFPSARLARWNLNDSFRSTYESYLSDFSKIGFNNTGKMDWRLSPGFPASAGFLTDICNEGGTLTTQKFGDIGLTQHYLEYELRDDTANVDSDVELEEEATLEFHGWVGSWYDEGQIYVVVGLHPNGEEGMCGLTSPHLEKVLDEVVEGDVGFELDESLWGQTHTVMGAVR